MTPRYCLVSLCIFLALVVPAASGSVTTASRPVERPKIGLVLGGGGARGGAHIGVLRVLEQYRIPVDYIAGTSAGAIIAGLYASGYTVDEIEGAVRQMDWRDIFEDQTRRRERSFRRKRDDDLFLVKHKAGFSGGELKFPPGVVDGQKIDLLLKRFTLPVVTVRDFDNLVIPYRAVAANLATGGVVVLGSGDLALAIRASISIPVVFAPREIDDVLLVDGGISNNLPVDVVREMGADIVIACDIGTPLDKREQLQSVLTVAGQLVIIMTRRNTDSQIDSLKDRDVYIRPDLGDITTGSFERMAEAIPLGVAGAEAVRENLRKLSLSEQDYEVCARPGGQLSAPRPIVDDVRVVNRSRLSEGVILSKMDVEKGRTLDVDQIEKNIGRIYGLGLFESVYYDINEESGQNVLTVSARENSWGPNYLQFGVVVYEDYEGPNFNVAAAYTRTAVNRLNGEWRTWIQIGKEPGIFTEFHQPLDRGLRKFGEVQLFAGDEAWNVFDGDGNKVSELGIRRYGVDLALGRELGTWGEFRAGVLREQGTIDVQVGDPGLPDSDFDTGELYFQFYTDELDDVRFPAEGGLLRIRVTAGLEELGSDVPYEQGGVKGAFAYSIGRNTGLFSGLFGTTRDNDAPVQNLYRLGGFTRLSGLERNELNGQNAAMISAVFYRLVRRSSVVPVYTGLSVEYGDVFRDRDEIKWEDGIAAGSGFLGLETPVGPIFLAYGFAEGGRHNFYLILGQPLGLHGFGFWD
jgi:NTE family protein